MIFMSWVSQQISRTLASATHLLAPLVVLRRPVAFYILCMIFFVSNSHFVFGQQVSDSELKDCETLSDDYLGNAQRVFNTLEWVRRGICVRHGGRDRLCYASLNHILEDRLNELRKGEYAGAAGVMALLPTIGALLGAPTNEIWRLMTMVPFGGALAMAMSFGGAILPTNFKDYESDFMKGKVYASRPKGPKRSYSETSYFKNPDDASNEDLLRVGRLMLQVQDRLQPNERRAIPTMYIWFGLIGMILLFLGAHASMIIVEQGSILPWWCSSRWWIHMWYGMLMLTAVVDNIVQLPFKKQWTLSLSDIPYTYSVEGGDDITTAIRLNNPEEENVGAALKQLETLNAGSFKILGSKASTACFNVLYVMISVKQDKPPTWKVILRACSQLSSIGVFITGTAMFASAQLLSIAMATFTLTLVLAAGVFGRTIAGWIVTGIESAEPMIHFVAESELEAHHAIKELLTFTLDDGVGHRVNGMRKGRGIQVEIGGHIFVNRRRILKRSRFLGRILGILNPAYDLSKSVPASKHLYTPGNTSEQMELSNIYSPKHGGSVRSIPTNSHSPDMTDQNRA